MLYPLLDRSELETFELPEMIADALTGTAFCSMSYVDDLARTIGHADDWETDEMGACASVYALLPAERKGYAIAAAMDEAHALNYHGRGRLLPHRPYVLADETYAYVRSDDCGFWDVILCDETTARGYLADWVARNVPTYCEGCGEMVDPDDADPSEGH